MPGSPLSEGQARDLVASNLCRCTGYQGIIDAIVATAQARRAGRDPAADGP